MKQIIVGIDEVGRGSLAGPLVSAAVVLADEFNVRLFDSKSISYLKRKNLADVINNNAKFVGLGWVSNKEIDKFGLSWSLRQSYLRAISKIDYINYKIILDGNVNYLSEYDCSVIVKADESIPCVSAASIVAKVARDNYMKSLSKKYKSYGFESNVGYGSSQHRGAIAQFGLTKLHRESFCKKILRKTE